MKQYPERPTIALETLDPNTSLAAIVRLVGTGKRILDVGCASGYQARLNAENGCTTVGIELSPEAAEEARASCEHVFVADVEVTPLVTIVGDDRFDVVIFGDVLEHLREPVRVLDSARRVLAPGGYVVASIPNIAHGAISLALMHGNFDYQPLGILDDTHIRFFTSKTVEELLLQAGFKIVATERTTLEIFGDSDLIPNLAADEFPTAVVDEVEANPEARTLQFVVRGEPLTDQARLDTLSERFRKATTQLTDARNLAERLRQRIALLEAERTDLPTLQAALARVVELELEDRRSLKKLADFADIANAAVARLAEIEAESRTQAIRPETLALRDVVSTLLASQSRLLHERRLLERELTERESEVASLRERASSRAAREPLDARTRVAN